MNPSAEAHSPGLAGDVGEDRCGYQWLVEPAEPRAARWVDDQDRQARRYLEGLPESAPLRARLLDLLGEPWRSAPVVGGGLRLELRQERGAAQPSLWVCDAAGERVLVDAAELSADGSVAISAFDPSPDGALVAWASATDGADWQTVRFRDPRTGADLPDELRWIKWARIAWLGADRVAYMAFAQPADGHELTAANAGSEVRLHQFGRPQVEDVTIYRPEETTWVLPSLSADRRTLLVQEQSGIEPATIRVRPADLSQPWRTVVDESGPIPLLGMREDEVIVLDLSRVPNGEVTAISATSGRRRTVVPEGPVAIAHDGVHLTADTVVVIRHLDRGSTVEIVPMDGSPGWQIPLPERAIVRDVSCQPDQRDVFLEVEEVAGPRSILHHNTSDRSTVVEHRSGYRPPCPVRVETVTATSADGTAVPMTVVRRAGEAPAGSAKVLLSVYGGYSVPFAWTGYASWHLPWLEAGGILAYAGIRGGGEYGEAWHLAATTTAKQRGIDDLIACASFFTEQGWAEPRNIALNGMSNGGMLVAAVLTQRPELLGAALPEVAVTDMLRFHLFTAGHGWIREFGSVDVPEQRAALAAYSPLHNVRQGESYPPTLLLAADHDDRVPPGPHTYRFTAALQGAQASDDPVLLRVARNAGHAAGRALAERVAERTAVLAFAAHALALPLPDHGVRKDQPETEETS